MKRVLLFIATNLAVMLILSIVLSILMPALGLSASSTQAYCCFLQFLAWVGHLFRF